MCGGRQEEEGTWEGVTAAQERELSGLRAA